MDEGRVAEQAAVLARLRDEIAEVRRASGLDPLSAPPLGDGVQGPCIVKVGRAGKPSKRGPGLTRLCWPGPRAAAGQPGGAAGAAAD